MFEFRIFILREIHLFANEPGFCAVYSKSSTTFQFNRYQQSLILCYNLIDFNISLRGIISVIFSGVRAFKLTNFNTSPGSFRKKIKNILYCVQCTYINDVEM